jgi:hypothetical protein
MRSVLERIVVRYPRVVGRCCEMAAIWVAGEAAMLGEGQTLRRNENDILPGLAQAVREYGIDPAEMARECGVDPFELRRKLALSRFGELLKPGEIRSLTDQALESKLQQAAREYNLEVDQLLDEISDPCAVAASVGAALTVRSGAVKIAWVLRCWMCRRLRPQRYRIDFTPHPVGELRLLSEPAYACQYCLPTHLTDQQVQQITRLSESKVPNSPSVIMRSAALAAVVILVFSSWYIHASGARNTRMPKLSTTRAPAQFTTEIEPVSETPPVPAEHTEKDPPAVAALPKQVPLVSTAVAPSPVGSGSQVSGIVTRKQTEIAAASVVTPPDVEPAQGSQLLRDQGGRPASSRATALNNCRDILHNERPLMRYSIRDAAQDADHEALSVAEACARTTTSLTQLGTECAGLFNWFEVFQSKLTKHVNRVCREAAEKDTTP